MLIEWLARRWSVNDPLPEQVELLVPVAHGATETRLTRGAQAVANRTASALSQLKAKGQFPFLVFGAFTGSKNPEIEKLEKLRIIALYGKFVGTVMSTIEECVRVRENLPKFETKDGLPRVIVVVTDEAHSRRCRIVWRAFFPNSTIKIVSVRIADTVDSESPMSAYGNPWKILFFQAAPTPVWWLASLFGEKALLRIGKLHTPTK